MNSTIDKNDISRFAKLADEWWNPFGSFKLLHQINPLRVEYIRNYATKHFSLNEGNFTPLKGLKLLDIGCGGGLVAEAMARLGADVTAIDATELNVLTAKTHAEQSGLEINYQFATAEELAERGEKFNIVLALEVIEHVANVDFFLQNVANLVNSNGMLFISTINRTLKSLLLAKMAAEYVLGFVPRGTHNWQQFLLPSEIITPLQAQGFKQNHIAGMVFKPLQNKWVWNENDLSMNYMVSLIKSPTD
jgi:2-polyprenyl-6-hydroxyphenyl methylase / 3-demethylubiquinone-9 3-methyltransferase